MCADTVIAAARKAAMAHRGYLVCATDGIDLPAGRKARSKPFTAAELPPELTLVWVTPAGVAPRSPLFAGLKNPTRVVPDLGSAVAAVMEAENKSTKKITGTAAR
jgi:hypothetical protein